ncbi:MAG: outer membrane beta-barrel protein [Bacteroidota bacterium]
MNRLLTTSVILLMSFSLTAQSMADLASPSLKKKPKHDPYAIDFNKGDILGGFGTSIRFDRNSTESGPSEFANTSVGLGLAFEGEYFVADNFSISGLVGASRNSSSNSSSDTRFVNNRTNLTVGATYYSPKCLCGDEGNLSLAPFASVGLDASFGTSGSVGDNFDSFDNFRGSGFHANAGVITRLKDNLFLSMETTIFGVNRGQFRDQDSGTVQSTSTNIRGAVNSGSYIISMKRTF